MWLYWSVLLHKMSLERPCLHTSAPSSQFRLYKATYLPSNKAIFESCRKQAHNQFSQSKSIFIYLCQRLKKDPSNSLKDNVYEVLFFELQGNGNQNSNLFLFLESAETSDPPIFVSLPTFCWDRLFVEHGRSCSNCKWSDGPRSRVHIQYFPPAYNKRLRDVQGQSVYLRGLPLRQVYFPVRWRGTFEIQILLKLIYFRFLFVKPAWPSIIQTVLAASASDVSSLVYW
jgi:hypothetical protein